MTTSQGPSMIRDEDGALTGYVYIDLNTKENWRACRRSGLNPSAIRYYERLGLHPVPHRAGGQRRYPGDALGRVLLKIAASLFKPASSGCASAQKCTVSHPARRLFKSGIGSMLIQLARQLMGLRSTRNSCSPVHTRKHRTCSNNTHLDYSGGAEELDKALAMFPSFNFDAALEYLELLRKPWLYSRLGFLLDRHADKMFFRGAAREQFLRGLPKGVAYLGSKRPGNRWVPTWKLMVPETFAPSSESHIHT